jgi:predicted transposase
MLLTVKAKLQPSGEQRTKLHTTMQTFNAACTDISKIAYETKTYNKYKLQHTLYHRIREQYRIPAQLAIRAISKVVESYRTERRHLHTFNPQGAVVYDERIMGFKGLDRVSLTTLEGRAVAPILVGGYAKLDQRRIRGQADLIYVKGEFYLCVAVETPKETPLKPDGVLGVDFGIVNIASTSDGVSYSG